MNNEKTIMELLDEIVVLSKKMEEDAKDLSSNTFKLITNLGNQNAKDI